MENKINRLLGVHIQIFRFPVNNKRENEREEIINCLIKFFLIIEAHGFPDWKGPVSASTLNRKMTSPEVDCYKFPENRDKEEFLKVSREDIQIFKDQIGKTLQL